MHIYLNRLLAICRIQGNKRFPPYLLRDLGLRLQNVSAGATSGIRDFSRSTFANKKRSSWRRFQKQAGNISAKEKQAEPENISRTPVHTLPSMSNPTRWIDALEPFLLPHLRSSSYTGDPATLNAKHACAAITDIIGKARETADIDVLARLGLEHGRWSAVISIVEAFIADAIPHIANGSSIQLPSNLGWPTWTSLNVMEHHQIELGQPLYFDSTGFAQWDEQHPDPRTTDQTSRETYRPMEQIWMSLGSIILESTDLPSERSNQVLIHAYQIIARLHNSGFVPDHVYSCSLSNHDSAVRRPGNMHLLSSRMLNTLSDAAWRGHQDEAVARAASAGATYQGLGYDTPGGQFTLKVPDLGPEVWLEFILWCCVDGGFGAAGCWIVEGMRTRNTKSPWSAVQRTGASSGGTLDALTTGCDSVKLRPGGTFGQTKGYSDERPSDEMESCTISAEVVLALVEALLNGSSPDLKSRGCTPNHVLNPIVKLLMFLEPHSLRAKYVDYLTVRLLQPMLVDFENDSAQLQSLVDTVGKIRSFETVHKSAEYLPSLKVDFILEQSEVYAGALHQACECLAVNGRVQAAVEIFSRIQDLVDQSKLRSIGTFLRSPPRPDRSCFSPGNSAVSPEYSASYGQLPVQKLAVLLDSLTFAGWTELGQWLVYSMDVDGPLIPLSIYGHSSVSPSLLRFAAATGDHILMHDVAAARGQFTERPGVTFLRSFADAKLYLKDFETADRTFAALNELTGGGSNLRNVATIAAMILRIESSAEHTWEERRPRLLSPGLSLLDSVLRGDFRGRSGDFRKSIMKDYRRGLACLLRVIEAIPDTVLSDIARLWIRTLSKSNVVGLEPKVFEILLSAVVETKGAKAGMMLWDLFCEVPASADREYRGWVSAAETKLVSSPNGLEFQPIESPLPGSRIWARKSMLPIKIDAPNPNITRGADMNLHTDATSEDALFVEENDIDAAGEGDADLPMSDADMNENGSGFSEIPLFHTAQEWSGLEEEHSAPANNLSVSEDQGGPPPRNPPRADISLPTDFSRMISEGSDSPGPMNDEVAQLTCQSLPNPVVRPTFRTLRIILHAALQELEVGKKLAYSESLEVGSLHISDIPAKHNMRNLEAVITDSKLLEQWARPLLQRFGVSEKDLAVEVGWKLGENDSLFSTQELQKRYARARTEFELSKMGLLANVTEVNRRNSFLGPKIRKPKGDVEYYTPRELAFYYGSPKQPRE